MTLCFSNLQKDVIACFNAVDQLIFDSLHFVCAATESDQFSSQLSYIISNRFCEGGTYLQEFYSRKGTNFKEEEGTSLRT